jgi:hypothetical protein
MSILTNCHRLMPQPRSQQEGIVMQSISQQKETKHAHNKTARIFNNSSDRVDFLLCLQWNEIMHEI